jgi:hypothetical protein
VILRKDNMEVSNETLLFDIKNTEIEVQAYHMIAEGFKILSELPEADYKTNSINSRQYFDLEEACSEFLTEIVKIKFERNI